MIDEGNGKTVDCYVHEWGVGRWDTLKGKIRGRRKLVDWE